MGQPTSKACYDIADGYVIIVTEIQDEKKLTSSIDYFFLEVMPDIKETDTPEDIKAKGGSFLSKSNLERFNLERFATKGMIPFDSNENVFKSLRGDRFSFEVFRVLITYQHEKLRLKDYLNREHLPHTHSFFSRQSNVEMEVMIMNPFVINVW